MANIIVDPVTRTGGHLRIDVQTENGVVVKAKSIGTLYRGFERIVQGRDPRDGAQLTQKICGMCSVSHTFASTLALEEASGVEIPEKAKKVRLLMLGSNFLANHILHFYHMSLPDYVKGIELSANIPTLNRDYRLPEVLNNQLVNNYWQAFEMQKKAQEMLAIMGGKSPHVASIVPGGITRDIDAQSILSLNSRLKELTKWIKNVYLPDVQKISEYYTDFFTIGEGCKRFLVYGGSFFKKGRIENNEIYELDFKAINEHLKYAWYDENQPKLKKSEAYSWLKAPRYEDKAYEVGPLARQLINQHQEVIKLGAKAYSVMGRHFSRAVECLSIAEIMSQIILEINPNEPVSTNLPIPKIGEGKGLIEAPKGALGHWLKINNSKIEHYNMIMPTTWNASPKDDNHNNGPMEEALIGTRINDENNPIEILRIIRSFDPCISCAVH